MKEKQKYIDAFELYLKEKGLMDVFEESWDSEDGRDWREINDYSVKTLSQFYKKLTPGNWIPNAFSWSDFEIDDGEGWEEISIQWDELIYTYQSRGTYKSEMFSASDVARYFKIEMNKNTKTL